MKKLFSIILFLSFASVTSGQWVVESFDNAVGNLFPDTSMVETNVYFYTNGTTSYQNLFNDADAYEGTGSMKLDYRLEARDSWGGYNVITTYLPGETDDLPYLDLSTGTELSLWYKVLVPADTTTGASVGGGKVYSEFKLAEIDADGNRDLWRFRPDIDLFDTSGEWINVRMPLVQTSDQTTGFALQFGDGDQELQFDKIKGFEITTFLSTPSTGNPDTPPTALGTILIDKMELIGNRYEPLQTFDTAVADSFFSVDIMSWAGDGASSTTLTDISNDMVEGDGAFQWDYSVNASQTWGGYARIAQANTGLIDSFTERTALVLYIKNSVAQSGTEGRVTFRFTMTEDNTGEDEGWTCEVPVNLSEISDWTRYYIPLEEKPTYLDTVTGFNHFPHDGFSQPWWESKGDEILNLDAVKKWHITLSGGDPGYGDQGEVMSGTLLFDVFQQSGFKDADVTAPVVPEGIAAIAGTYSNLITWTDIPGEDGESYNVYFSENPISDILGEGVGTVQVGISEGVQVVEHVIIAPATDQEVTFYYAVNSEDRVGNVGTPGLTSAVINTAKGVTTIHPEAPVGFAADGDLSEWDGIRPFRMFPDDGSGTIVTNKIIDGDADLSVNAWVAMDQDYVYIAYDVNDDIVSSDTTIDSWMTDAPDIHLGLYNLLGAPHTSYGSGETPDYQFRFNSNKAHMAQRGGGIMAVPSDENYYWGEKFTGGYIVEIKMSFADIAAELGDDVFVPQVGTKVPIDFGINDADATGEREGILTYSATNQDQSWNNPSRWTNTWIGDEWVVGVEDDELLVNSYGLSQNYPNPFNPTTSIKYSIEKAGNVSLKVFNILGQQVAELLNKQQVAGSYEVNFDAGLFSTGIYFYEINSGSFREVKKMMLIK